MESRWYVLSKYAMHTHVSVPSTTLAVWPLWLVVVHWTTHPHGDPFTFHPKTRCVCDPINSCHCKLLLIYIIYLLSSRSCTSARVSYFAAHLFDSLSKHVVLLPNYRPWQPELCCVSNDTAKTKTNLCANLQNKSHEEQS